jgi:hypothetical protein
MFEFESGTVSFVFLLPLFHLENYVCLSHGVHVAGMTWCRVMRIVAGVRDLVQRIRDGRTGRILDDQVIERSSGVICSLHLTRGDEQREFLD